MEDILKRCSKCGQEKPATSEFFYKDSKTKDGFSFWCIQCQKDSKKVSQKEDSRERKVMEEKITKICTKCEKELPATNEYFSKNKALKDGLERWCKDCKKKKQQDYRNKKAKERGRAVLPQGQYAHIGRSPKKGSPILKQNKNLDPITRATPDEILIALRNGIRKETAEEIFQELGQAFVQIKERFG